MLTPARPFEGFIKDIKQTVELRLDAHSRYSRKQRTVILSHGHRIPPAWELGSFKTLFRLVFF
ncbi:hypothetical protein F2Q70_00024548 [Brassica cretica]|uniref:Uncharacterized protein n=1 Tax=Brassica cretica TaxID=69181 RepID=A0A8S9L7R4_BRACR|nr:hypothetical protein F2Q70_00024548 [Brassica cretica]